MEFVVTFSNFSVTGINWEWGGYMDRYSELTNETLALSCCLASLTLEMCIRSQTDVSGVKPVVKG